MSERTQIAVAFITVVIVWSITPLAVKWSASNYPLSSALLRMLLGIAFCGAIVFLRREGFAFNRETLPIFIAGGISIFTGLSLMYIASKWIPSGWIAVVFGLSPLMTGLFSIIVEPEDRFTTQKVIGLLLGLIGLLFVFRTGLSFDQDALKGVSLVFISVIISSASSVLIRHLGHNVSLSGLQTTVGSLAIALPLFIVATLMFEPVSSISFTKKEILSIIFLGIIGTGVGFTLYYYLLRKIPASKVALVALITPITSLLVGNWFNNEEIVASIWIGGILVCLGLLLYQYRPIIGWRKL